MRYHKILKNLFSKFIIQLIYIVTFVIYTMFCMTFRVHAATIYNQTGLSFSGTINANEIVDTTMTGYDNWPSGFEKNTIAFEGGVYDGKNIWMIPYDANMIVKINTATGIMTGYDKWPAGFDGNLSAKFYSGVYDGTYIWMIPYKASMLIRINTATGEMTGYQNWPTGFEGSTLAFSGGVYDGTNIWMIPYDANMLVKINTVTFQMTGYNTWPSGFVHNRNSFGGGVYDSTNIWMIPYSANMLVKVDLTTGGMTGYSNWPTGFTKDEKAFSGGIYDGANIWMVPFMSDTLMKIDVVTGKMTGYSNWPSDFKKNSNNSVEGGTYDGKNIWMIPYDADSLIKFNSHTAVMSKYNNWPSGIDTISFGGVYDGNNLWLIPQEANMVVKVGPPAKEPIFSPLNIEVIAGSGQISFKNWVSDSGIDIDLQPSFTFTQTGNMDRSTNSNTPSANKSTPNVDGNHLVVDVPQSLGEYSYNVIITFGIGQIQPLKGSFTIKVVPAPVDETMPSSQFTQEKTTFLNTITASTTQTQLSSLIEDYSVLMEHSPSKEESLKAFDDLLNKVKTNNPTSFKNDDIQQSLSNLAVKEIELTCNIKLSSYLCNNSINTVIGKDQTNLIQAQIVQSKIIAKKINTSLLDAGIMTPMEPILKISANGVWDTAPKSLMEMPDSIFKQIFDSGINNVILSSSVANACFNRSSINPSEKQLTFIAERITKEKFDLKIQQDHHDLTETDGFISIHLPYNSTYGDESSFLTVFRESTSSPVNMVGMYNNILKRMVFNTKHFSIYYVNFYQNTFSDLNDKTAWSNKFIQSLAAKGVIKGFDNSEFKPYDFIKREEFATMIVNIYNLLDPDAKSYFTDVRKDIDWFYPFVSTAVKYGLMNGCGDSLFGANNNIIKQDSGTVASNSLINLKSFSYPADPEKYLSIFKDNGDILDYARNPIAFIVANNIIKGDPITKCFYPKKNMTRAEAAVVLYKLLLMNTQQGLPSSFNVKKN